MPGFTSVVIVVLFVVMVVVVVEVMVAVIVDRQGMKVKGLTLA